MDLNKFDKHIKSSLENLEAPYDPSSWQALESKLDSAFLEEQPAPVEPVDLVVKKSLERMEVPFQPSHWNILQGKLNQVALVRRVRLSKLAEVAIFLLLLINIEGFLGGFNKVIYPTPPVVHPNMPMADNQAVNRLHQKSSISQPGDLSTIAKRVITLVSSTLEGAVPAAVQYQALISNLPTTRSVLDPANFYGTSGLVQFQNMAPLPQAKMADFAWETFFEIIPGVSVPAPDHKSGMYAATFAAFDHNIIKASAPSSKENGFGGGFAIGYRKGSWGFETGLLYTRKAFTPIRDVEIYAGNDIDGYLGAYVHDVDAEVFTIPLKVTKRLARFGTTSAYAVAGLSAAVATEKRIGYKTVYYQPSTPGPGTNTGLNPLEYPIPVTNNQGLFEGGTLRSNAYATADLGLRLEQPLGKRYVAFVEPSYRHSLGGGFGPKQERVNTVSFQAGILATL